MSYFKLPDQTTVFFDVDDTLVLLDIPITAENEHEFVRFVDVTGEFLLKPHKKHIQDLKDCHKTGHNIIVWSQAGSDWAATVVKTLELSEYVDIIMNKPDFWYDDLTADYTLQESFRRWYEPGE